MCAPSLQIRYIILSFLFQCRKARRQSNLRAFTIWDLCVDLCSAAEAEGHPSIGVDGHLVNDGQPELLVKLGEGIQFLHLEHERTNGFCLSVPCGLCGAELFKLRFCFFVPLHKAVVPSGIFLLVLRRLRVF